MDVFDLDRALLADYARFARSFTQIGAADIRRQVGEIYASNPFWPDPLISINPHFEPTDLHRPSVTMASESDRAIAEPEF
jgi:hypothetical protein